MKLFPAKGWGFFKKNVLLVEKKKENGKRSLFQSQSKGSWPFRVTTLQLHEEVGKEKIKLGKYTKSSPPSCSASHKPRGN